MLKNWNKLDVLHIQYVSVHAHIYMRILHMFFYNTQVSMLYTYLRPFSTGALSAVKCVSRYSLYRLRSCGGKYGTRK